MGPARPPGLDQDGLFLFVLLLLLLLAAAVIAAAAVVGRQGEVLYGDQRLVAAVLILEAIV